MYLMRITNYMGEKSPYGEANSSSASQEIPQVYQLQRFIQMFATVHHLSTVLSHMDPIHTITPYFFNTHSDTTLPYV
jgi:hypothetical protein